MPKESIAPPASPFRKFNIAVSSYYGSQFVDVMTNCNALTFTNVGDDIVRVNDMILYPGTIGSIIGDSLSIGGNEGEIYDGTIILKFAGAGANPAVEVVQKTYVV